MLSDEVLQDNVIKLRDEGYFVLDKYVERNKTDALLRDINAELGRGMPPEDAAAMRVNAKSFGSSELLEGAKMRSLLFDTGIFNVAARIYGITNVSLPSYYAQVALRFPQSDDNRHYLPWHIDNVSSEIVRPFGLLIGVFLNELSAEDSGNLTVYPGGHKQLQSSFRTNGTSAIRRLKTGRIVTASDIELVSPKQLCVSIGDVIFAHPMLPHRAAPNLSPNIRVAIYFRIYNQNLSYDHPSTCILRELGLKNIWALGWTGMKGILEESDVCDIDPFQNCNCGSQDMPLLPLLSDNCTDIALSHSADGSPKHSFIERWECWVRTSFCSGSFGFWERSRRFIVDEIPEAGKILDIGCANGFLLYCLKHWSQSNFEPYGIDPHWCVKFAGLLFPEQKRNNFVQMSLSDYLLEAASIHAGIAFDMIYWNVWDNQLIDIDFLQQIVKIMRKLSKEGKLVLGFYGSESRNQERMEAIESNSSCFYSDNESTGSIRRKKSTGGHPHELLILGAP